VDKSSHLLAYLGYAVLPQARLPLTLKRQDGDALIARPVALDRADAVADAGHHAGVVVMDGHVLCKGVLAG